MTNLTHLTIEQALKGLEKKEFTAVELTEAHIKAMEKFRSLNAYIVETPEIALKQAAESDKRRAGGKAGLLDGLQTATHHAAVDVLREVAPKAVIREGERFLDNGRVIAPPGSRPAWTCHSMWWSGCWGPSWRRRRPVIWNTTGTGTRRGCGTRGCNKSLVDTGLGTAT